MPDEAISKPSIAADFDYPIDQAFSQATKGKLPMGDLLGVANRLTSANEPARAILLYQSWLANSPSPLAYAVHFNLGVLQAGVGDIVGAEASYRAAIAHNPAFLQAYLNLGSHLERQARYDEALEQWREAVKMADLGNPESLDLCVMAYNNLGRLMENRKNFSEAEAMLKQSLTLKPEQVDPLTHWVHLRQKQCEWPVFKSFAGIKKAQMLNATSALAMLSAAEEPEQQLAAAKRFIAAKVKTDVAPLTGEYGYQHDKLRIGYLSGDFCSHAVSILTAELYELHDRSKVTVYGFDWSREDGTPMRARVAGAMDHLIRIDRLTDEQAARLIRSHEIDILVDLQGLTAGTRPTILYHRPAPVQLTYLGFPGPTGLTCLDYVLADEFVLPPELQPFFTEKALYMPNSFQINDRKRAIGPKPTRAASKLPEDVFVFCSFNNNFKFSPDVFGAWMRILKRVPDSVLWLVADSEDVRRNLSAYAEKEGVDAARLIFAERVQPADYLARYQVADLFLDTAPFNAGTTASDALWAGLPLLTWSGKTFSSRMAGSLLKAVDLPELITFTLHDYEEKAVEMGLNRGRIEEMKQQLTENRLTCALFDTPRFVSDLEDLFATIVKPPRPAELPAEEPFLLELPPVPAAAITDVMVIINESDIEAALQAGADLATYKTYVFEPGLVDNALKAGLQRVEYMNWEDSPLYFDLDKKANDLVFEIEEALTLVVKPLLPSVSLLSWQHLHMYYMVKHALWYQGLWAEMAPHFENTKPHVFLTDNPSQFYWPSFIPALILLEHLLGHGIPFNGFTAGARNDDMGFVPLLVQDPANPVKAEILTHMPTCFYDAKYLNEEIAASGKSTVNITSKYWDIPIEGGHTVGLHRIGLFEDGLDVSLKERIEDMANQLRDALEGLLAPFIRTPDYRQRQASHISQLFRAQIWTFFMLEAYFAEGQPKKMMLSDHDTDFQGPLVSYAEKNDIPILVLPHSKVSPDLFYSYRNTTSLMHPMCGETIQDAYGKRVLHHYLAYPESIARNSVYPKPLARVGLMLNAMTTNNGVLNTRYQVYMEGIRKVVQWCRENDMELAVRCKPTFLMTSLLKNETGIDSATLSQWTNIPMSEFAEQCDVCLMFDAPTSGALEFLSKSIPILNPVPEELSKVEARVCDPRVVPRASVEKTLLILDGFVADTTNLFHFRENQFQNYVRSYDGARPLRSFI